VSPKTQSRGAVEQLPDGNISLGREASRPFQGRPMGLKAQPNGPRLFQGGMGRHPKGRGAGTEGAHSAESYGKITKFYQMLESRLDVVLFRLGFARTLAEARHLIQKKEISVNGKLVKHINFLVDAGSLIVSSIPPNRLPKGHLMKDVSRSASSECREAYESGHPVSCAAAAPRRQHLSSLLSHLLYSKLSPFCPFSYPSHLMPYNSLFLSESSRGGVVDSPLRSPNVLLAAYFLSCSLISLPSGDTQKGPSESPFAEGSVNGPLLRSDYNGRLLLPHTLNLNKAFAFYRRIT
jgi:hypothetical protein